MIQEKYISLELAKKIHETAKEKCVELPESEYRWDLEDGGLYEVKSGFIVYSYAPAYDTYELLLIIPENIMFRGKKCYREITNGRVGYWSNDKHLFGTMTQLEKEKPESLGQMLLYLLENNLFDEK